MGTVHARSLEPLPASGPDFGALGEEAELVEVEPEAKQEILENKDVVVQHVHFDGLGRTKDDIIMYEISDVFKAKNLIDVMRKSHEAREKLLRLGIFRQVEVLIDTCQGDDALPNGLDVIFEVTELRRLTGSYNTMVGNNEGSMVLGLKFPNLFGRAEKHAMVIDSRNSSILPKRGALLKINQVFSASLWGGMLVPIGDKPSSIADRFYLGGPTSVRGFSMYSIGPQSDGDGPKAHLQKLAEYIRWSYGAGIVLRLGNIARLELNYCFPMGVQSGDRICDGVQFGAGIRFL
ncbi:UNVERIFIED_CONTAM: hypothetical protein H355_011938 [Colinus virginianus]|nr:hypothetical protein H355_011938 [Colinus virginianus]